MGVYERTLEKFARMPIGDWYMKKVAPRVDPPLLRLTGGRISSVYPVPIMLLTTTGAKTGLPRTLPLLYVTDGDHLILIASNYGKTSHPAWYRNLAPTPGPRCLRVRAAGRTRHRRSPIPPSGTGRGIWRWTCTPVMATTRAGRATARSRFYASNAFLAKFIHSRNFIHRCGLSWAFTDWVVAGRRYIRKHVR